MEAASDIDLLESVRLCLDRPVPYVRHEEAVQNALRENPKNTGITGRVMRPAPKNVSMAPNRPGSSGPVQLALTVGSMWAPGRTLRVRFLTGTPIIVERCKSYINQWTQYANIKFEFVSAEPSDIRIDFKKGCGSWSFIGTDALLYPDEATVNFGWLTDETEEEEVSRVVLHEFGHVLGCIHEHQSPNAQIKWDEAAVYDYFRRMSGWDEVTTHHNILEMYPAEENRATAFDPESIMLYFFESKLIQGGAAMKYNTKLSDTDKVYIAMCYPKTGSGVDVGSVNTTQINPIGSRDPPKTSMDVEFHGITGEEDGATSPKVALGMSWIDAERGSLLKLAAKPTNITSAGLTVEVSAANNEINSAGYSYLRLPSSSGIQCGESTYNSATTSDKITVKFTKPFPTPPKVVSWFSGVETIRDQGFNMVAVTPDDITPDGFTLRVGSSQISSTFNIGWLAHDPGNPNIASGRFVAEPTTQGQATSHVDFGKTFQSAPHVMMAISYLGFMGGAGVKVKTSQSMVTAAGMNCSVESWGDSKMAGVEVSYIALAPVDAAGNLAPL